MPDYAITNVPCQWCHISPNVPCDLEPEATIQVCGVWLCNMCSEHANIITVANVSRAVPAEYCMRCGDRREPHLPHYCPDQGASM